LSDGHVAIHPAGGDPHGHAHAAHHPKLQHHFDDMAQQAEASTLGMWVFLVTEIMFFGGLFTAYLVYRWASPEGFAEASNHLNVITSLKSEMIATGNSVSPIENAKP